MKTATFSNGYQDTYRGKRDVKAAWAVIRKGDGKVIYSGHSLTRQLAEKTAKSNIPLAASLPTGWQRDYKKSVYGLKMAQDLGYKNTKEMERDYKRLNAEKAKEYKIEVLDIQ